MIDTAIIKAHCKDVPQGMNQFFVEFEVVPSKVREGKKNTAFRSGNQHGKMRGA